MQTEDTSASPAALASPAAQKSPRFLSLGDGNEILQVALAAGDSIACGERAFCYRGLGLRHEVKEPQGSLLARAARWGMLKNDRLIKWTNEGPAPSYIGLSAPVPGKVIPIKLQDTGSLMVQPRQFLCSMASDHVSTKKLQVFSRGALAMCTVDVRILTGAGMCYIHTAGGAVQKTLESGESIVVEMGCVAAVSESCAVVGLEQAYSPRDLSQYAQCYPVKIVGPGTAFIQSTHESRISAAIREEARQQRSAAGAQDILKAIAMLAGLLLLLLVIVEVPLRE